MDAENPEIYLCDSCGYQTAVAESSNTTSCSNCSGTMTRLSSSDQLEIDGQTLDIEKVIDLNGLGQKAWQDRLKIDIRNKNVTIVPRKAKEAGDDLEEDISDQSATKDLPAIDPSKLPKDDSAS